MYVFTSGQVLQIKPDNTLEIEFLHPASLHGTFRRPPGRDVTDTARTFVFMTMQPPVPVSGGRFFKFEGVNDTESQYRRFAERLWG